MFTDLLMSLRQIMEAHICNKLHKLVELCNLKNYVELWISFMEKLSKKETVIHDSMIILTYLLP